MAGGKGFFSFLTFGEYDGVELHIPGGGCTGACFQDVVGDGLRNGIALVFADAAVIQDGVEHVCDFGQK